MCTCTNYIIYTVNSKFMHVIMPFRERRVGPNIKQF